MKRKDLNQISSRGRAMLRMLLVKPNCVSTFGLHIRIYFLGRGYKTKVLFITYSEVIIICRHNLA